MAALHDLDRLADRFADLASAAGAVIMRVYAGDIAVRVKPDASPVTDADEAAEAVILPGLATLLPGVPIVAEEQAAAGQVPDVSRGAFLLVDPLDGTREFTARNGEFTVNIALIDDGAPVAGVVYAPATGAMHLGGRMARAATLSPGTPFSPEGARAIRTRPRATPLVGVASRSHCDPATLDWLARHGVQQCVHVGSALKFGTLAEGGADVYPRFSQTSEWDTAAGHAVLVAAGGAVLTLDGAPLRYGKPGFVNGPFIAWGEPPR